MRHVLYLDYNDLNIVGRDFISRPNCGDPRNLNRDHFNDTCRTSWSQLYVSQVNSSFSVVYRTEDHQEVVLVDWNV